MAKGLARPESTRDGVVLGDHESSAGLKDAPDFSQADRFVLPMIERVKGEDQIGG